jgi:hypothetical protein
LAAIVIAAAVAAGAVLLVVPGRQGEQSLLAAAYAQLAPRDALVYLKTDTRWYSAGKLHQHARSETWYSAAQERSVATSISRRSGRPARYLEVVRDRSQIRSYISDSNTLTIQANCWRSGASPRDATIDPIAKLRSLFKQGRVIDRGQTTFDGHPVTRLVAAEGPELFTYYVTRAGGEPVAMRVNRRSAPTRTRFTGTVVRFVAHDRGPLDTIARATLMMRPHPDARVVDLGRSRCPRG